MPDIPFFPHHIIRPFTVLHLLDFKIPLTNQQPLLAKAPLPSFQPTLLHPTQRLPRILETPRHNLPQPLSHQLDNKHSLPIAHSEACTVAVKCDDPGVEVAAYIAAEERDGEVGDGGGFMGVVEPDYLLVPIKVIFLFKNLLFGLHDVVV